MAENTGDGGVCSLQGTDAQRASAPQQVSPRFRTQRAQFEKRVADLAVRTRLPRLMRIRHVETPVGQQCLQLLIGDSNHSPLSPSVGLLRPLGDYGFACA